MNYSIELIKAKLATLASIEGFRSGLSLLHEYATDAVVPGICMSDHCDGTADVEPVQDEGLCELCHCNTVMSATDLMMRGLDDCLQILPTAVPIEKLCEAVLPRLYASCCSD